MTGGHKALRMPRGTTWIAANRVPSIVQQAHPWKTQSDHGVRKAS